MNLVFDHQKCTLCGKCIDNCPFNGIDSYDSYLMFNASCRMCNICLKICPENAIFMESLSDTRIDKLSYKGVLIVAEQHNGQIHPVTYELLGKGRQLADELGHELYCVVLGDNITPAANGLLNYQADTVYVYDYPQLRYFSVEPYTHVIEDLVDRLSPSIILMGATHFGRSLAPRVAVRLRTGLTADCTVLNVKDNTDLVQIRPAFGGDIMAQIITPNHRPQMATVRFKVMEPSKKVRVPGSELINCTLAEDKLTSNTYVLENKIKGHHDNISDAEVVIAFGRGVKEEKTIVMIQHLAKLLDGVTGTTRPMVEAGWADYTQQIGLSGRTIRPKLLVAIGISGAVQFCAGASGAEQIFAINKDETAPIFNIAHYGVVGDLNEIIPKLIVKIEGGKKTSDIF